MNLSDGSDTKASSTTSEATSDTKPPYRVCIECGKVYQTPEELVKAYEEAVEYLKKIDSEGGPFMPFLKAEEIQFCQECLHDFPFPPYTEV